MVVNIFVINFEAQVLHWNSILFDEGHFKFGVVSF